MEDLLLQARPFLFGELQKPRKGVGDFLVFGMRKVVALGASEASDSALSIGALSFDHEAAATSEQIVNPGYGRP
jgi:hypothetical protein